MTIYILSNNPAECARMLDDDALGKMISDIAQVCCNTHYMFWPEKITKDIPLPHSFRPGFTGVIKLHEWSQWARTCLANYNALLAYARACCEEYIFRYVEGITSDNPAIKKHKHQDVIEWCENNKPKLPLHAELPSGGKKEQWPLVMPEKYKYKNVYAYLIKHGNEEYKGFNTIIESYRAYCKAKCKKRFGYCKDDDGFIEIKAPKFTRREIPGFLGDL